ncbi:MAG: type VI secretion system ImpB/VipA family protein [Cellvibrionaceae bacterium]|jgi:type VI secretion system ImpB/VipA family protein
MSEFEQRTQRMNLTLQRKGSDGNDEEVELPLKLLVTCNFQGVSDEFPIAEGSTVNINKDNFNTVMHATAPRLQDQCCQLSTHAARAFPGYLLPLHGRFSSR